MNRTANCERRTNETKIQVTLGLDGTGKTSIHTGIGFFDHMLDGFARHGLFDLTVAVSGDLEVDCHHTIEDTGIVLGQAIREAVGDKAGIRRYGHMILPMDETLALCAVDLSGRPYLYRTSGGDGHPDGPGVFLRSFLQRYDEPSSADPGRGEQPSYGGGPV